ncbi:class I SAM-dependent methyltransferase [Nonomuraea sp. NPDC050383]|uniref:class I SAM-dependent methyltransferase n=1 Tax=Nonomuraea sp. NPDC050383 TaxID=3364362 RepID=UPI00378F5656
MDKIPARLTGVRATALLEQYLRALDSDARHPILADPWAPKAVRRLDHDFTSFRSAAMGRFAVALRSRVMDLWITRYLARHPDATVVDLGSGLDNRSFRVDPPHGHLWFDLDFPDVIDLARRLYPERPGRTGIGASVLDPDWLKQIPGDRPVVVVADGLFGFLAEEEVREVFRRIVDHFPTGEIVFNNISTRTRDRHAKQPPALFERLGIEEKWALHDARAAERLDERLLLVEKLDQTDMPLLALSPPHYRLLCSLITMVPAWRESGWILRHRF